MLAAQRVGFHPRHVAVTLLFDPLVKMRRRLRDRIGMRDAERIEAFRARARDQLCFDRGRIVQKSRSV